MLELNAPVHPIETLTRILPGQPIYINGLNLIADQSQRYGHGHSCLAVLITNAIGDEVLVDLISPSAEFWVVLKILNLHFPSGQWRFLESWQIAEESERLSYSYSLRHCRNAGASPYAA